MTDPRILTALGLPVPASETQIAEGLRDLAGLPRRGDPDVRLWARFMYGIDWQISSGDTRGDRAQLANSLVGYAIIPPGDPGEDEYGTDQWDRELGVGFADADETLRGFVFDEIAPRLQAAGLYRLL